MIEFARVAEISLAALDHVLPPRAGDCGKTLNEAGRYCRRACDLGGAAQDHFTRPEELREIVVKLENQFKDSAPLSAGAAATIILDGVRAGNWRILVGQDAIGVDRAVRAKPEAAYDYAALAEAVQAERAAEAQ